VRADRHKEKRQAAEHASAALTSVMPAIERPPLTLPGTPSHDATTSAAESHDAPTHTAQSHGGSKGKTGCEHTGPQDRRSAHPGRRPSRVSKHVGTLRAGTDGEVHDDDLHTRVIGAALDAE
jgi:hypothetical protein